MPTVEEQFYNLNIKDKESADIPYIVYDAVDEGEVFTAIYANSDATLNNGYLFRTEPEITERIDATTWRVNLKYEDRPFTEYPDSRFSFDTTGGTQHITASLSLEHRYSTADKLAYDTKKVIGYNPKTGDVEGADIIVPVYNFSETHFFSNATVNNAFKQVIFGLTGQVNDDTFKGFEAGEVLFLGASGARSGDDSDDRWEITYRFAASENNNAVDLPGAIVGPIVKEGWEFMIIQFYTKEITNDDDKKMNVKTPAAVYIHRVYKSGDFSTLDIGVV